MRAELCLTCASSPLPSEKPSRWHHTPCCDRAICTACITRRPRLARYCLLCQRSIDLTTAASTSSSATSDFVIGDDDEDGAFDEKAWPDEPPAYDATEQSTDQMAKALRNVDETAIDEKGDGGGSKEKAADEADAVARLYYIAASDTLVGIAFSHGITPRQLASYNKLPPAVLTVSPSLLHTRQFLLLPPNARPSASPKPLLSPEEEHRRRLLRRFQIASKCAEPDIAKIYLDAVFADREKERDMILENRRRRNAADATELPVRVGGEVEDALVKYEDDKRWETQERKAGRRPPSMTRRL